jgi:hypothetical protein
MTTDPAASVPNPVQHRDAAALIGILAILEGEIWAGSFDEQTAGKRGTIRGAGLAGW